MDSTKQCSVKGCVQPYRCKGYCNAHYKRVRHYGHPWRDIPLIERAPRVGGRCFMADCGRELHARGLCLLHYKRYLKHGDPATRLKAANGEGGISRNGYRRVTVNGHEMLEHRLVMERALGRPLTESEVIHHISGNKLDNRLENLLLTNRSDHQAHEHFDRFRSATHKECIRCHRILPRTAYSTAGKQPPTHDPHCTKCKECTAADARERSARKNI